MNTEEIIIKLKNHKSTIVNKYNTQTLGLFGSYVENNQNDLSDIDILVSFKKGNKDFFNFLNLKYYLEELFKTEVDLVNKDSLKPALKDRILKQVKYV